MDTDTLHTLVTSAIWRAEKLEDHGLPSAAAWAEVSAIEEQLATALPLSLPEGRIARRGAVRAALQAGDYTRSRALIERYCAEEGAPKTFCKALRAILEEDEKALASRFRFAAKHYRVSDAREAARRLQEGGPFGLAAA